MQIYHGTSLIADDARLLRCNGLLVATELQTVANRLLRSDWQRLKSKGNLQHNISFSVLRHHASEAEAEGFYITHAASVSGQDDTTFVCGDASDSQSLALADAHLQANAVSRSGRTTVFQYSITGGQIT